MAPNTSKKMLVSRYIKDWYLLEKEGLYNDHILEELVRLGVTPNQIVAISPQIFRGVI